MIPYAIIGTGKIVHTFLEAAAKVPELKLFAVYSRTLEKARAFGEEYGAERFYDSLEALAADTEIKAVYIASPNCCHCEQSIQMMEAGKHVLCEKPIASNLAEYEKMLETARRCGVIFFEAMRSVFTPEMAVLEEALPFLGKLRQVNFSFCQYSSRYDNYKQGIIENAFKPELSNGSLMDLGVYCVHPMVRLFGLPKTLYADAVFLPNGVDGAGSVIAGYGEMQVQMMYSKICDSRLPSEIQGENGSIVIDKLSQTQKMTLYLRGEAPRELPIVPCSNNMEYEIARWADWIQGIGSPGELFRIQEDSHREMQVLDEIRRLLSIRFPADEKIEG